MDVTTYKLEKCTVRIHSGKRTEEERREALERAAIQFAQAVEKKSSGYWKHNAAAHRQ